MEHWRAAPPADRFPEADYEALAADPEPVIRRVIDVCAQPWDDTCLTPERSARSVNTPSKRQVRPAASTGSVGRWKLREPWLGPLSELK